MSHTNSASAVKKQLTWVEIIKFYLPLAAAAMLMIGSINVANSALSRTATPQIALAAFAIGFSYAEMIAAPCFSGMNMLLTLGRDRVYFFSSVRFMLKVTLITVIIIAILAFTPIGRFVAINIGGASANLFDDIKAVWQWSLLLPVVYFGISTSRSVLLVERATLYVTFSRLLRLIVMLVLAFVLPSFNSFSGATIGAIIMLAGMSTEAIIGTLAAIPFFKRWPINPTADEVPPKDYPPTQRAALNFTWPLIITSLMWGVSRPLLFAGLARMANPELTIATYRVATDFVWLFMAFVEDNIKQVSIAFLRSNPEHRNMIIRFSAYISVFVMIVIMVAALTPIGIWAVTTIIGVEMDIALKCIAPILVLSLYPLALAVQEYYQGKLLLAGKTQPLGFSKVLNIIAMSISVFIIATIWPKLGAVAGALAILIGMIAEMFSMRYFSLKYCK